MSLFTWIGAAVGFNLAHFKFISFDFNFSTEYNYIRALLSQDAFRIPLNSFACTLSGALLGLLTHMTWDVSIPSLVVFLTLSIVTSKQCTKLFSSVCVAPTQKPPITKEEEEEKNEIQQQKEGQEGEEEEREEEQKRKDQEFESELLEEKDKKYLDTEIKSSVEIDRKEQEDKERERERKEQEDREREVIDRESEESEEFQDKIATNKGVICSQRKRRSNH
jgi:hypothetical protein